MKLTLSQVLEIADVSAPNYAARRRRELLHWMRDSAAFDKSLPPSGQAYEAKRQRYEIGDVMALVAFESLVSKANLPLEVADYIVGNRRSDIFTAIADQSLGPADTQDNLFIGIIRYADPQWRNHVFGTLSQCVAKYVKAQSDGTDTETVQTGFLPISLILLDLTKIYQQTLNRIVEKFGK